MLPPVPGDDKPVHEPEAEPDDGSLAPLLVIIAGVAMVLAFVIGWSSRGAAPPEVTTVTETVTDTVTLTEHVEVGDGKVWQDIAGAVDRGCIITVRSGVGAESGLATVDDAKAAQIYLTHEAKSNGFQKVVTDYWTLKDGTVVAYFYAEKCP